MTPPLVVYQCLVDELREARRALGWKPEDDRETLALLIDLWPLLSEAERDLVEDESWRSWPDLYDQKMAAAG